jgi:tetratricopeptide (TPR) repeat protein/outer membrane protein OmpA-like peptidoglycan-associated protein
MKMKTIKISALILAGISLSSCDSLKELTYTVTPDPLEMHGDSVRVKIEVKVPEKGIKKKIVAEITPKLGTQSLEPVKVAGEKIQIGEKSIPYKPGGKVVYDRTYAYDPSFESSDLEVSLKAYKGAVGTKEKKKEAFDSKKIAEGTIITPFLVQPDFKVVPLKQDYIQTKDFTTSATINFDRGRSELRPNEMKDADVVALKEWLQTNAGNSRVVIKSISVNGFACPDGVESKNVTLSDSRVSTALKAIETLLKDTKYPAIDLKLLSKTKGLGEDFDGFVSKLNESTLASDEKSLITRVIKETSDLDTREKKIKEISKVFSEIEKDIFPKLRRAEIVISYSVVGYSNDELKSIGASNPSSLKLDELIQAAEVTSDLKTKQTIYTTAFGVKSDDKLVLNNLGVLMYEQGKYDEAKSYFEKSGKIENSAENKNNLAAVAGKKGDFETAKKLLDKNSLAEAKFNSGYFSIKKGKYAEAINSMKGGNSFNLALAQLLNGKSDEAIKTLDGCTVKETAEWFYLKAVANARLNNVDGTVSNLKSAIAKNASLKEKAGKDKEFRSFTSNSSFSSLIK